MIIADYLALRVHGTALLCSTLSLRNPATPSVAALAFCGAIFLDFATPRRVLAAIGVVTILVAVTIVILAIKALLSGLSVDAVTEGTRVLTAVGVITVNTTIAVVVFAIEAFAASLVTTFVLAAPASDLATIRRIIQAVRILAVLLAVTVVVATIKTFLSSLSAATVAL